VYEGGEREEENLGLCDFKITLLKKEKRRLR